MRLAKVDKMNRVMESRKAAEKTGAGTGRVSGDRFEWRKVLSVDTG